MVINKSKKSTKSHSSSHTKAHKSPKKHPHAPTHKSHKPTHHPHKSHKSSHKITHHKNNNIPKSPLEFSSSTTPSSLEEGSLDSIPPVGKDLPSGKDDFKSQMFPEVKSSGGSGSNKSGWAFFGVFLSFIALFLIAFLLIETAYFGLDDTSTGYFETVYDNFDLIVWISLGIAALGFIISIVGLIQVSKHSGMKGKGKAWSGIIFAIITIAIALIILFTDIFAEYDLVPL